MNPTDYKAAARRALSRVGIGGSQVYDQAGGYLVVRLDRKLQYVHRLLMSAKLGRTLTRTELVHHRNENKRDNRIQNLVLTDRSAHQRAHRDMHTFVPCGSCGNRIKTKPCLIESSRSGLVFCGRPCVARHLSRVLKGRRKK